LFVLLQIDTFANIMRDRVLTRRAILRSAGGLCVFGTFEDDRLIQVLGISKTHEPLLIMPVVYKR